MKRILLSILISILTNATIYLIGAFSMWELNYMDHISDWPMLARFMLLLFEMTIPVYAFMFSRIILQKS